MRAQVSTMQEQVLAFQAQAKKLPKVSTLNMHSSFSCVCGADYRTVERPY